MKRQLFSFFEFRHRKPAAWKMPLQPLNARQSAGPEQGVALVITLILLAVITFMAVTFLVVSRSEKGSVVTTTDQTIARMAADSALERAKTEAMARIIGFTNPFNFDLLVSTNYINPAGFIKGNNSYTNVSFNYPDGTPVTGVDALQNLSRLLYNPRVPVVITNRFAANSNEFRFYLDLNRNGRYDTNGYSAVINALGGYFDTNGFPMAQPAAGLTLSNHFVGDPEWIGGLERMDLPHSASNRFLFRYAYLVVPASKALDVNYIHNYARLLQGNMSPGSGDGFTRNQGVGTWEINLAGFLTDLNTNYWPFPDGNAFGTPYNYLPFDLTQPNRGAAFDDALAFVRYRYNRDWRNWLPSLQAYFNDVNNGPVVSAVSSDYIDAYSHGPIMTNTTWPVRTDGDRARVNFAWSGSDNPNAFFTTQDYFDPAKTSVQFSNRLWNAGRNIGSYDRYTYYRLLSQLGTDSSWEQPGGKINLSYDNVVKSNAYSYARSATNFLPWRPIDFFRESANKMLANAGFDASSTNPVRVSMDHIQIYPTNFYTPSVHQILQMAANIYDSTTNPVLSAIAPNLAPPTVFKPIFTNINNGAEIAISGFEEVTNADQMVRVGIPWRDLSIPSSRDKVQPGDMIYGIPLIIGAKKGFPNFNELAMQTSVQVTRKLEFRRKLGDENSPPSETNQMYTLTVSNVFGMEAWNSYSNAYPRRLQMRVFMDMFASLWETNELNVGKLMSSNLVQRLTPTPFVNLAASNWPGYINPHYAQASFRIPFQTPTNSFHYISNRVYRSSTRTLDPLSGVFERNQGFPVPHWYLHLRTRLRYYLIDTDVIPNRVVDFVNLDSTDAPLDVAQILASDGACLGSYRPDGRDGSMWCTNRMGGNTSRYPTMGIQNQIGVGQGLVEPQDWNNFLSMAPPGLDQKGAIDFFRVQFGLSARTYPGRFTKTNVFYAPFAPTRTIFFQTSWQANDPLVHYTIGDLVDFYDNFQTNRIRFENLWATNNMGSINKRYEPWGGNPAGSSSASPTARDWAVKDPLVTRPDDWDFPTNKFANIGWLGRVHRGTPWQTINLKSPVTNQVTWMKWSGNGYFDRNVGQFNTNAVPFNFVTNDAAFSHPINDRYILDLFTTSINDNATRGQLSVNQTNLAAWSAVLSGVNVMPDALTNTFIAPAGVYNPTSLPPVAAIVQGIQRTQTRSPGGVFRRLGDVLATPELTVASPLLSNRTNYQNDAVYERIPQQILGLLKGADEPRFVIYSFGQALKPADRSQVTAAGPYFGLSTNYQVVAEVATRSVVRIEGLPQYPSPLVPQKPYSNLRAVVERFNILPPE